MTRLSAATFAATLAVGTSLTAAAATTSAFVGPTNASQSVSVTLSLPSADPAGAAAFVSHVNTPGDPLYHQYLTPAQYAARFGAKQADYQALLAWARANKLTVGEQFAGRTLLAVSGTSAALGRALGVSFADYRDAATGRIFAAASGTPALPAASAAVIGLNGAAHFMPYVERLPKNTAPLGEGTGPNGAFSAADLRTAYDVPAQAFTSQPQKVAVFEQGGFDPNDVATYLKANKLPSITVTPRSVDGYGTGIDDPNVELEAVLDVDMLAAVNPALKQIVVYEDGTDTFQVALLDTMAAVASDDTAKILSISYGQDETLQGAAAIAAENTVLTEMAAQGQAVFASSGDDGTYGNFSLPENVSDPASQPFVTGVGGTTLFTGKGGVYNGEESWDDFNIGAGATGGGISTVWPIPSYQLVQGYPATTNNGGSGTMRNVPDIAADANPLTGVAVYSAINGGWITIGGTSVAAPVWAGFYSLVDNATEALGLGPAGFANPDLYTLSQDALIVYPLLHDVLDGGNGAPTDGSAIGFFAGYGYDNCTGLGSFAGANLLLNLVLVPSLAGTNAPPTPRGLSATTTSTSVTATWTATKGATGYAAIVFQNDGLNDFFPPVLVKSPTATISGLKSNTYYYYIVLAISPGGTTESPPDYFKTAKKS